MPPSRSMSGFGYIDRETFLEGYLEEGVYCEGAACRGHSCGRRLGKRHCATFLVDAVDAVSFKCLTFSRRIASGSPGSGLRPGHWHGATFPVDAVSFKRRTHIKVATRTPPQDARAGVSDQDSSGAPTINSALT
jgi:hypothetical protein